MKVAIYVRVSRIDLNPENQLLELRQFAKSMNWDYEIFEEKESTRKTRPIKQKIFQEALQKKWDLVFVYKLDRWARSLQELINDFNQLQMNRVQFRSLKDNIILDDDPRNMLMIQILGAFAEFERAMIRERTMAGLARARAEGKRLGRPKKKLSKSSPRMKELIELLPLQLSSREMAKKLNSSRYRVEKALEYLKQNPPSQTNQLMKKIRLAKLSHD